MLFLVYYLTRVVLLQLVYKIMSFHNIAYGNIQDYKKMHNATKRTIVSNNVFSRWTETRTLSKTNLFQGIAFILILMTSEIIISNEKVNYINKWLFSVIPVIISDRWKCNEEYECYYVSINILIFIYQIVVRDHAIRRNTAVNDLIWSP